MGLFDAEDTSHDYVNLVMSKGLDISQMITGLCTGVAFQDIFRIAPWLFAIGWQVKSFKPESKLKLTSSLVGNVIVHLCFLTFSSFSSLVRDLFQNRFLFCCVVTHLCREMGLLTGANDVPVAKIVALHSSTSLVRYTKKLFKTNRWLTLCFILSQQGIANKFSSLPTPARFPPKSTCTVDTTIYQTQVRMFFKAHSLKAFEQPLIFRNRSESKHLGPYSYMINTVSDGFFSNTL